MPMSLTIRSPARPCFSGRISGMPPPTLASYNRSTFLACAASNSSRPSVDSSSLFAVTTGLVSDGGGAFWNAGARSGLRAAEGALVLLADPRHVGLRRHPPERPRRAVPVGQDDLGALAAGEVEVPLEQRLERGEVLGLRPVRLHQLRVHAGRQRGLGVVDEDL